MCNIKSFSVEHKVVTQLIVTLGSGCGTVDCTIDYGSNQVIGNFYWTIIYC